MRDVAAKHERRLAGLRDDEARLSRLCELNVMDQVQNVCRTSIVEDAWDRGQPLSVHGWIYGIHDGLLRDLKVGADRPDQLAARYQESLAGSA